MSEIGGSLSGQKIHRKVLALYLPSTICPFGTRLVYFNEFAFSLCCLDSRLMAGTPKRRWSSRLVGGRALWLDGSGSLIGCLGSQVKAPYQGTPISLATHVNLCKLSHVVPGDLWSRDFHWFSGWFQQGYNHDNRASLAVHMKPW